MEQSHITNPIIQEWFVSLSSSLSLSFCLLWNNFSASLHKADTFVFGVCFCSKSFLLYFAHAVAASQGDVLTLFSLRMNYLKHNQLAFG